jgi:hypothetical protein
MMPGVPAALSLSLLANRCQDYYLSVKHKREASMETQLSRRSLSRVALAVSALVLVLGGVFHGSGFPKVSALAAHSNLNPVLVGAFNGLWLCDSTTAITMGLAFGLLAAYPGWAARQLIAVLALVPLTSAVAIYMTMGVFIGGHVMLAAGAAALVGAALRRDAVGVAPLPAGGTSEG